MTSGNSFSTIKVEGGLLSSDYLHQIAAGNGQVPGLSPSAYHLSPGERLSDAISSAWNIMRGRWAVFKDAVNRLPETDHCTSITRDRFLLPLFDQLGYGRLLTAKGIPINGIDFPISHAWGHCPIHLMGWNVPNDKRTAGVAGASHMNPHSLVQQFLNLSEDHLWGFLSNGHLLRVLRDNKTFARQSFIEFDLEAMFDGEIFSDFAVLFLVCHESRVEADKPHECYLEQWVQAAARNGTRALEQLRFGVEEAIREIGQGFLEEPANTALLHRLRNGSLSSADYFRQILRLIYRMLFLFAAEDRGLLHPPQTDKFTQKLYRKYYSLGRVRDLAAMKTGTRHSDLWECLALVFNGLNRGIPALGLPGLDSFLWAETATEALNGARLSDKRLLSAIRHLAYIKDRNTRARVDYRNLGSEELGGIYENILELTPSLNVAAGVLTFATSSISERSETDSHYTPSSLVGCLCDSALEPVIERALRARNPEQALLDIKVCDPACGSGHFLVAAARRIAKRLAYVRTGELEPSPEEMQRALRDVVGRCVYGVDLSPMAVELCKVSLWFEALEPGKPMSFLDPKIKTGNSLIGATPALIANGIPDAAFTALEGDDKQFVSALKRTNKQARAETNLLLFSGEIVWEAFARIKDGVVQIEGIGDESLEDIRRKQKEYETLLVGDDYRHQRLIADAWCAAFTCRKAKAAGPVLTQEELNFISEDPENCPGELRDKIDAEATKFSFFHWQLEFPEVFEQVDNPDNEQCGWSGGFDVVLGNPPWDRVKLAEKEWFARRDPRIATAANAAIRKRLISSLKVENPGIYEHFKYALRVADANALFLRASGRYPLCGRGDVNTYTVFAELSRILLDARGFAGLVIPSGIATDDTTKFFIQDVIDKKSLVSLFDFENKGNFPDVDSRFKFCLFTAASGMQSVEEKSQFVFFAHDVQDIQDVEKRFTLEPDDIALLNPNTRTIPVFRSKADAELTKFIYRHVPVLISEGPPEVNSWGIQFATMFHMSNDSSIFRGRDQLEEGRWELEQNIFTRGEEKYLPLYEAKMANIYDHRNARVVISRTATIRQGQPEELSSDEHRNSLCLPTPRAWVPQAAVRKNLGSAWSHKFLLVWRGVSASTNERTVLPSVLPLAGVGNSLFLFFPHGSGAELACLVANISQMPFDFVARQKMGGVNVSYFIFSQLPVLPPAEYAKPCSWSAGMCMLQEWLLPRVLELTYTAWDLEPFARECGYSGPPIMWNEQRRFLLRCELDAAFFHLYLGTPEGWANEPQPLRISFSKPRDAVAYIMDTFPIVRKKDEQQFGRYRTKETILEIYDAMAEATRTGQPYKSLLDAPAADAGVAHTESRMRAKDADRMRPGKREPGAGNNSKLVFLDRRDDLEDVTVVRPAA